MSILARAKKFFKPEDPVEQFYDRLEILTRGVRTSSVSKAWGFYHPGDLLDQDTLRKRVHNAIIARKSEGPELFEKYVFPVSELMDPHGPRISEFLKSCWIHEIGRLIEFSKGIVMEEEVADLVLDGVDTSKVLETHLKAYLLGQSLAKRALPEDAISDNEVSKESLPEPKILDIQDHIDTEVIERDLFHGFKPDQLSKVI